MIGEFIDSWELFQDSYLAALFGGVALSVLGVLVVARNQLFFAVAVSQACLLGIAVNLWLEWDCPRLAATAAALLASSLIAFKGRDGLGRTEETTAWIFLTSSSLSILLLAKQPFGLKEVQSLFSSSVIGASRTDVVVLAILAGVGLATVFLFRSRLTLFASDPVMAAAVGMKVALLNWASTLALGAGTGLVMQTSGLLFTFGCLALPALIAINLCTETRTLFIVAPITAVTGVGSGLVVANYFDFPPGQMIVGILAGMMALSWGGNRFRMLLRR